MALNAPQSHRGKDDESLTNVEFSEVALCTVPQKKPTVAPQYCIDISVHKMLTGLSDITKNKKKHERQCKTKYGGEKTMYVSSIFNI